MHEAVRKRDSKFHVKKGLELFFSFFQPGFNKHSVCKVKVGFFPLNFSMDIENL